MRVTLSRNGSTNTSSAAHYITWVPSPCRLQLVDPGNATTPVAITLRNQRPNVGGQVVLYRYDGRDFTAAAS